MYTPYTSSTLEHLIHHCHLKDAHMKHRLIASHLHHTMSVVTVFIPLLILLGSLSSLEARVFLVGGSSDSWKVPTLEPDALDKWAEEIRFQIGDSLVWKYEAGKDSVLEVTKEDFLSCNTSSPIEEYNDGSTTVTLTHSGPYFFISGTSGHCEKGLKLTVVVLSTKHMHSAHTPAMAPAPAPASTGLPPSSSSTLDISKLMTLGALVGFGYLMM